MTGRPPTGPPQAAAWSDIAPGGPLTRPAVFALVAGTLLALFALCAAWEPVLRDGWTFFFWHREHDLGPASVWEFARNSYLNNNPRAGEIVALLLYQPGPLHVVLTPLANVGGFVVLSALVLGRWPSPRRGDDVLVFAVVSAMVLAATPEMGRMFGHRAFVGNYVYGFLFQALLLVPYRFHAAAPRSYRTGMAAVLLGAGLLAGMSNEHTGGALALALIATLYLYRRRGDRWAAWMLTGLVGLIVGYLLLLLAPGQSKRYDGLFDQGTVRLVFERGVTATLVILGRFLKYALLLAPWLAVAAWVGRGRGPRPALPASDRWTAILLYAAGAVIVLTVLASPKQGARLFYAPMMLWVTATMLWVRHLWRPRGRAVLAALAAVAIVTQGTLLLRVQHRAHLDFEDRLARLEAAPKLTRVVVPRYSQARSPWFLGDDFHGPGWRGRVAVGFGLAGIDLEPGPGSAAPGDASRLAPPGAGEE